MSKKFSISEKTVATLLPVGASFVLEDEIYTIQKSGKPHCVPTLFGEKKSGGEPKTDIYVRAFSNSGKKIELKISYKQQNADFLENKIKAERAKQILGDNWSEIISTAIEEIEDRFYKRPIIFKKSSGRTSEGAITLGWRYEFVNKQSGELSAEVSLTEDQIVDIYSGTHLSDLKKHAMVSGELIFNSGVANYVLLENVENLHSPQDVINSMRSIEEYVHNEQPRIYFACKALNYLSKKETGNKVEANGRRPLSVYIEWSKKEDALHADFVFDKPLEINGRTVFDQLYKTLDELGISTTDDIDEDIVDESVNILQ